MPDKEANLIIRLKDEASKGLQNIKGSVLAVSAAVAGLTAFLVSSLKSFLESDKAVVKLNSSLKAQGIFTQELSKEMQNYAKELQRQTTFSDEAIISSQTLLTTFGLAGIKMKEATKAAVDLSSGLGIDLHTATLLVGKAFSGQVETLGRYGIKVNEALPPSEKFGAVLAAINQRFGGAAQDQAESYAGKIENLKNRFDDVKEEIGQALIPVLSKVLSIVEFFIGGLERLGGIFPTVFAIGLSVLQDFVQGLQTVIESIPFLSEALGFVGVNFDALNEKLQTHIDNIIQMGIQDQTVSTQQMLNSDLVTRTQIENQKRFAEEAKKKELEFKKINEERVKRDLDHIERVRKAHQLAEEQKLEATKSTLTFVSSLTTAKSKELAAIGKAAAIAVATMDTYAAANKAMAQLGIFGPPAAAAIVVAGLANVAKIAGIQLAEGGVVMPRMGGVPATLGEAGKAEAVIPLGSDRAREQMAEAGLGGTTNINISVGTLVGSEDSVRELAKMIDEELFSLRRNNESVAFEAL